MATETVNKDAEKVPQKQQEKPQAVEKNEKIAETEAEKPVEKTPQQQQIDDLNNPLLTLYLHLYANQTQLSVQEYVSEELSSRVSAVNGQVLLTFLQSCNFHKIAKSQSTASLKAYQELQSAAEFTKVIDDLIKYNYIKRVVPLTVNKKRYQTNATIRTNFAPRGDQSYDDDGLYALLLQPPQSSLALVKSLTIVGGIFAVCCFKIWPVILRIALWWLLLFTTIFLITSIIIHLFSKIIFTLLCLRGYSFMPNLLDEEIGFFETFSPVLGTGGEHQKRWALEREIQLRARQKLGLGKENKKNDSDNGIAITSAEGDSEESGDNGGKKATGQEKSPKVDKVQNDDEKGEKRPLVAPPVNVFHTWQAGLFAFIILFILGGIGCYNMGFFDPEMVPDFLVNNNEMRYYFPAIAATSSDDVKEAVEDNVYVETGEEISV